ncbi:hypothetical protein FTO74_05400 [Granulicella sp. WH15]|uniref:hypothetical protein n=1 Tax=Granulicella sp. WH15 TaxID=2602070 RepID=UPI0013668292|nr:hypothetical protein [Granulicella sp. WH15]QHN02872.1 hypothetical protein FTO74_05400 [Granulicella sp. WH15]
MRGNSLFIVVRGAVVVALGGVCAAGYAQAPQASGVKIASAMQSSPSANDGIARALASCPSVGGCTVEVDQNYHGVEELPVPKTDLTALIDLRGGSNRRTVHNPPLTWQSVDFLNVLFDNPLGAQPTKAGGWGGYHVGARTTHLQMTSPGWSLGVPSAGAGGWTTANIEDLQGDYFGSGINQGLGIRLESRGIGDKAGEYIYNYCYGGLRAGADEGCEGLALHAGEGEPQYAGTVTGPAGVRPGATMIKTFADEKKGQDPGNQGVGRTWVEDAPLASVVVAGIARSKAYDIPVPMSLDPDHALPAELVSTGWGTLNDSVAVPQVVEAGGTTSATFDVTLLGGGFTAHPGDTLCFGGSFHEQALVTEATGPHGTHLTAALRHSHVKGSWVSQGGAACSMIDFDANHIASDQKGGHTFDFPFDVIAATDTKTLMVTQFDRGRGLPEIYRGNLILGATVVNPRGGAITNQHGTITIPVDDGVMKQNPALMNQPVVTISGAHTASFNGLCKDFLYVKPGTATCTGNPAHDGDTDNVPLHISVGTTPYGNGTATLHRAAEIVDVRNTELLNTDPQHVVDGTLTLEANQLLNKIGSMGHIPHDYAEGVHPLQAIGHIYNPYSVNYFSAGVVIGMMGKGVRGVSGISLNSLAAYTGVNMSPNTNYVGLGGTAYPPNFLTAKGVYENLFQSQFAPYPSGSVGVYFGCPPTSYYECKDEIFSYSPNLYKGYKGELRDNWTPYTDEYLRKVSGGGTASTERQTPAGFGFDAPVTATAVATPMYTPKSSTADCPKDHAGKQVVGAIWGDGSYLYQCVAPNKIKRTAALSDF